MAEPSSREPASHAVMFWVLAGMSIVVVAPCLFVPGADALAMLAEAEVTEAAEVAWLEARVAEQERYIDRASSDPQVARRLAMRDLGYHPEGRIQLVAHTSSTVEVQPPEPGDPREVMPAWVLAFYPHDWAPVYRDPVNRRTLWYLSIGVLFFAVVAYTPRRRAAAA